jgi:hypothetical protein
VTQAKEKPTHSSLPTKCPQKIVEHKKNPQNNSHIEGSALNAIREIFFMFSDSFEQLFIKCVGFQQCG